MGVIQFCKDNASEWIRRNSLEKHLSDTLVPPRPDRSEFRPGVLGETPYKRAVKEWWSIKMTFMPNHRNVGECIEAWTGDDFLGRKGFYISSDLPQLGAVSPMPIE